MPELTIVPPKGLVKDANPASGQTSQFALFSNSWLELQGYVGSTMELPITTGDFEAKYGALGSSQTIKDCIEAMRKVRESSTEFGNPKTLRAALIKNPNLLATKTPPSEIFSHTVWMGQRVHETAGKIISGYDSVYSELKDLPPKDQVESIKAYLFDQTLGPIPLAKQMSDEVGVLIKKIGVFEQKMNEYNEKLQSFTRQSSALITEVDQTIGGLSQEIRSLEKSRDEAYKAWKDFTIAAVTTSVGCALIGAVLAPFTGGISLLVGGVAGLATGIGLGVKAAENRAKYNEYCKQLESKNVEIQKKQRLRSDLGDFNTQMQRVGPAMSDFLKNLQTMQGVWTQMNTDMLAINNNITEANVGNIPFLVKSKANLAIDSWKAIDSSAKQFTVSSMVDYTSIPFGRPMPDSMAKAA
ncbi:MAG: alpha-xenorhabdolysin family binary toxin subunit A [Alkalinema sp. RU_4_3]|nr:alpha-xenorhabdolysin family binary toxin subunit A [Alkalinema sp. RU_4_3]